MTDCKGCGKCCDGSFMIEPSHADALREPRIKERAIHMNGRGALPDEEASWIMPVNKPCPFLDAKGECEIYATRPDVCRGFQKGSHQCMHALGKISFSELCERTG